jgi:hypothetical protein
MTDAPWLEVWTAVYALATIVMIAVLLGAAIAAWKQLREATRARLLEAINQVYRDVHSEDSKAARKYVYDTEPAKLTWPGPDRAKIEKVADTFEHVGVLAEHSLVAKSMILDYFWEAILQMWCRLKPYIEATRLERGQQYADHFERLAKHAEEYRKRKYPDYKVDAQPSAP